jgi:hypothetical protein
MISEAEESTYTGRLDELMKIDLYASGPFAKHAEDGFGFEDMASSQATGIHIRRT